MKTGVFVVGAYREIELCSKTWNLPADADIHLLTWSLTQDAHTEVQRPTLQDLLKDVPNLSVKFKNVYVFPTESYPYTEEDPRYPINKGPWFWREAHNLYEDVYDRVIILRPDIFLWSLKENPWDLNMDVPVYTVNKRDELFFVLNKEGFKFLSSVFQYVDRAPCVADKNVHDFIDEFYDVTGTRYDQMQLSNNFTYFLARPNSRKWKDKQITKDDVNDILQATIRWGQGMDRD
jgi:hypothetical protein